MAQVQKAVLDYMTAKLDQNGDGKLDKADFELIKAVAEREVEHGIAVAGVELQAKSSGEGQGVKILGWLVAAYFAGVGTVLAINWMR